MGEAGFVHFFVQLNQQTMKKLLSLLTLLSVISVGVYAQGVSGGVKLGLNLANQTISAEGMTVSPSFRTSIHAGGYVTVMVSEKFGVQPEILYSGQGAKNGNFSFKANYITVPVLLRWNFTPLFSIHAGPQMGILMSAKEEFNGESEDVKDDYKSTDIGIAAGLGIDLPMGLNFGFRFVKGMSNIVDSDDYKQKNYALQFSVGYKLFGKK
jgi:hypothetical protein